MLISMPDDIAALRESDDVECKLAAGRTGRGEVPADLWSTYSAFANTAGGYIVLGLKENADRTFTIHGILDVAKVKTDFFTTMNNRQKVSASLTTPEDVEECIIGGKTIIVIHVRAASRHNRPVYVGSNPMSGTYRRVHDADQACSSETVKRMLAEQLEDSRDDRILKGFSFQDLSLESVEVYRRVLRAASPNHPFLEGNASAFLRSLRAWRKDRESGVEGLTVAGLLMFGTAEAIRDEFPNYALDYQERDVANAGRWVDRLTTDGTWSGNVFDFYRLVWRKLTVGLKVPFNLVDGQRQDETPVHTALREGFVNCLVHADYACRASVLVVKRPDMFGFRNPGDMRVPVETAVRGGESDGRNRTLQQMFLLIGAGERAGSGVPKIHKGWREQHWRPPRLHERSEPSQQTLLELRMEDLLPQEVVDRLRKTFPGKFNGLSSEGRVVVATALLEITVSHARAMTLCEMHPTDMTRLLQSLVQDGFLVKVGQGRGSRYHLKGVNLPDPDAVFATTILASAPTAGPSELTPIPSDLQAEPSDLDSQSSDLGSIDSHDGRTIEGLDLPLIDDLSGLEPATLAHLRKVAQQIQPGRMQTALVDQVLMELCARHFLTLKVIGRLIGRGENYIRQNYMNRLAATGALRRAFPQKPNDPRQAYTSRPLLH